MYLFQGLWKETYNWCESLYEDYLSYNTFTDTHWKFKSSIFRNVQGEIRESNDRVPLHSVVYHSLEFIGILLRVYHSLTWSVHTFGRVFREVEIIRKWELF